MSKGNTFENDLLKLIFNGTAIANMADNAAAAPLADLYVALHTADPGEGGSQSTSEVAYVSYARQAVARSGVGWTVTNNSVSPAAAINFPQPTGGADGVATHFSIGTSVNGAGKILYSGTITPNIAFGVLLAPPQLTTATAITED